jgi:hypothetical protein
MRRLSHIDRLHSLAVAICSELLTWIAVSKPLPTKTGP